MDGPETPDSTDRALEGTIRRTRAAIAFERFARAFWPLGASLAAGWALVAFGIAELGSSIQVLVFLGLFGFATLWLLVSGIRLFRWPSRAAALARLDATLPGRPLAALSDRPALGGASDEGRAVWAAHLARMRRRVAGLRAPRPDPDLPVRDPWALRLMALVLLLSAAIFARGDGVESVAAALSGPGGGPVETGPAFEGWAEPPAYTGRPTLYLPEVAGGAVLPVPEGTIVTLRSYGGPDRFTLTESVTPEGATALGEAAPGIASAEFSVARDGDVILAEDGAELRRWSFVAEPDAPPAIDAAGPVERTLDGEARLDYAATDDHGVTGARAEIALDLAAVDRRHGLAVEPEARGPLVVDLPLPMTGAATEVAETLVEDFSKDPWAGLPVSITLVATDAVGQEGRREGVTAVLPGRRFYNPLAAGLVEMRRDLLWSIENGRRVTQVLKALTYRPDDVFDAAGAYLVTRTAIRRLDAAVRADAIAEVRDEVAEALWKAALLLEEGSLGDAAERLARAKERLQEALRDDASDEEIARLMDELRQATRDYMEQMAREALERGDRQQAQRPPPGQTMSQDQIQQLMDRIQELSDQGRKAEAEAMLEMLQRMLENMEMMLSEGQGQGQGQGMGQGGQGQQSMEGLADTLRQQQGLADESFQQLQREFREGRLGQGRQGADGEGEGQEDQEGQEGQGQGREEGGGPGGDALADRQEALRGLLDDLRDGMPGGAGEDTRQALRDAERSMGQARDALRDGETAGALDRQAEAIDNLRDGIRGMAEDMRRAEGQGGQGDENVTAGAEGGEDPLGRPAGTRGAMGTNESMVPDADAAARARGLLDEIRRRTGDRSRPEIELDYLRRLLDRF